MLDADLPFADEIRSNFAAAGFTPRHHEIVTEVVAPDWPSFVRKSALRADSFLARLADTEFVGEWLPFALIACGAKCREKFTAEPARYVVSSTHGRGLAPATAGEVLWTCPMHPQIVRKEPGNCPICGMTLEPMTPAAGDAVSPELRDMTRRFWVGVVSASGQFGKSRLCAGIVGHADLRLGDGVARVLEAEIAASDGRFRGIRHSVVWDPSEMFSRGRTNSPKGQMADPTWRAGFARLAPLNLTFEAWPYHPQLIELADLARAFPQTTIILNHVGGPPGIGPYADKKEETFAAWKAGIAELGYPEDVD